MRTRDAQGSRGWRLVPSSRMKPWTLILFVSVLLLAVVDAKDWFEMADANHDGVVDRTEYDEVLDKFMAEIESAPSVQRAAATAGSTWNFFTYEGGGFWKAFTSSLTMILATEIGDKTFFIAAVLSMKHDRLSVFAGAIAALTVMTVLSTGMGLVLPKFLDKKYTHILSGILFLYFGVKLILDSRTMEAGKASEELEEVEEELLQQSNKKKGDKSELPLTTQQIPAAAPSMTSSVKNSVILTALTLTFVAEWGDRSQIATIALGSSKNPAGVTVGGILGHCICTASACIGGRMLASNISEKTVSFWGGIIFLLFGVHSLFFEE